MILVTLGTQKQEFKRLLDKIEKSNIKDEIIVQAGHTKYQSKKMQIFDFINYQEMNKLIDKADLIITHGGTGSILMPLKKEKKVIACARLKKYQEHVDDHQEQIVSVFSQEGYIKELKEEDNLDDIIKNIKNFKPKKYQSNTDNFIKNIQKEIASNKHPHNKILYLLIIIILLLAVSFIKYLNPSEEQLAILQYHHIIPEADIKKYFKDSSYPLSLETFEEEMEYLHDNGYQTLTIEEFIKWKEKKIKLPEKSVMITIDDGCTSLKEYINPVLKKYNFTAIAFIITERVNKTTPKFKLDVVEYVGTDFLNDKNLNLEFGSHSNGMHKLDSDNEPIAALLNKKGIAKDLNKSYEIVNSNIYSYPFSYFNDDIVETLKDSHFDYAMRGHNKKTYQNENDYLVSRIGDIGNMETFKKIFETSKYDQTIIDKIKGIWVKIKY